VKPKVGEMPNPRPADPFPQFNVRDPFACSIMYPCCLCDPPTCLEPILPSTLSTSKNEVNKKNEPEQKRASRADITRRYKPAHIASYEGEVASEREGLTNAPRAASSLQRAPSTS